jgi:hypothetical protein
MSLQLLLMPYVEHVRNVPRRYNIGSERSPICANRTSSAPRGLFRSPSLSCGLPITAIDDLFSVSMVWKTPTAVM